MRGRPLQPTVGPEILIGGQATPTIPTLRILGLQQHLDRSGASFLSWLEKMVPQLTHKIQRVCSRRHGLKEADTSYTPSHPSLMKLSPSAGILLSYTRKIFSTKHSPVESIPPRTNRYRLTRKDYSATFGLTPPTHHQTSPL